uniref:Cyclin N-terminal domain-containing protein n=1 Tax=Corethron hystrix TaxID=216773 RepID=A0A7S1B8D2_9STRA
MANCCKSRSPIQPPRRSTRLSNATEISRIQTRHEKSSPVPEDQVALLTLQKSDFVVDGDGAMKRNEMGDFLRLTRQTPGPDNVQSFQPNHWVDQEGAESFLASKAENVEDRIAFSRMVTVEGVQDLDFMEDNKDAMLLKAKTSKTVNTRQCGAQKASKTDVVSKSEDLQRREGALSPNRRKGNNKRHYTRPRPDMSYETDEDKISSFRPKKSQRSTQRKNDVGNTPSSSLYRFARPADVPVLDSTIFIVPTDVQTSYLSSYGSDYYEKLLDAERCERVIEVKKNGGYMTRQPKLDLWMRSTLVDWLVELAGEYSLTPETLFLAVRLVDSTLDQITVNSPMLQCVGW